MPYIPPHEREIYTPICMPAHEPGQLNFQISMLIKKYLDENGLSYRVVNDISGACTEALAEFRRRVVADYEDDKIDQNGDIYD